jgi:hypothetical protein
MAQVEELYCSYNGRAAHDLLTLTGLVVLQEQFNYTDHQVLESLKFNTLFQYALNIFHPSDSNTRICSNTYINFRHKLIGNSLIETIFNSVTSHLADIFNVDLTKQRLDSVHYSDFKIIPTGNIDQKKAA